MMKSDKGMTLLEALVSTVIIGIGFVAVFQMVNYSIRSIDVSSDRTKANYLVSMVAEDLISEKNKSIRLELVDGPFDSLDGQWLFSTIDEHNTKVSLEISYKFKSSIIELSIEPIYTSIMNSILESFIQEAFKLKYDN